MAWWSLPCMEEPRRREGSPSGGGRAATAGLAGGGKARPAAPGGKPNERRAYRTFPVR